MRPRLVAFAAILAALGGCDSTSTGPITPSLEAGTFEASVREASVREDSSYTVEGSAVFASRRSKWMGEPFVAIDLVTPAPEDRTGVLLAAFGTDSLEVGTYALVGSEALPSDDDALLANYSSPSDFHFSSVAEGGWVRITSVSEDGIEGEFAFTALGRRSEAGGATSSREAVVSGRFHAAPEFAGPVF